MNTTDSPHHLCADDLLAAIAACQEARYGQAYLYGGVRDFEIVNAVVHRYGAATMTQDQEMVLRRRCVAELWRMYGDGILNRRITNGAVWYSPRGEAQGAWCDR